MKTTSSITRRIKRPSIQKSQQATRADTLKKPQENKSTSLKNRHATPDSQKDVKSYADARKKSVIHGVGSSMMQHRLHSMVPKSKASPAPTNTNPVKQTQNTGVQHTDNSKEDKFGINDDQKPQSREILNDPNHVTDGKLSAHDFVDLNGDNKISLAESDLNSDGKVDRKDGRELLSIREPQAEKALEGLSEEQRAQYDNVHGQVKGDTRAEMALQEMLIDGRLTNDTKNQEGRTLLQELDRMATAPDMKGDVNQQKLVRDVVQEIDNPTAIAQRDTPTCAPTTVSYHLAKTSPENYARIAGDLAIDGKSTLANDHTIYKQAQGEGDKRSESLELMDSAFMEYANGADFNYDGKTLEHINRDTGEVEDSGGLTSTRYEKLFDAVTGQDTTRVVANDDNRANMMDQIQEATESGAMVPTGIKWSSGGHKLMVTKVDDQHVYYYNPHGKEERMDRSEFQARLRNTHIP